jgi:hypothetical protein
MLIYLQQLKDEDIYTIEASRLCRHLHEDHPEVFRGMNELASADFILLETAETAELTSAGAAYDLLSDYSLDAEVEYMTETMRGILSYFTERGAKEVSLDRITLELGITDGEVDDALGEFEKLGYPVRKRIHF